MLFLELMFFPAFLCRKLFFTVFKERKLNNPELDEGKTIILPGCVVHESMFFRLFLLKW